MNFLKSTMKVILLLLLLANTSCQEKYPDLEDGLYAEFVTSKGTMVAKLFYEKAPVTVANFVALAEGTHPKLPDSLKGKPYYNGTTFHRVIDKFMIQGGDPTGTGSGGPGYKFGDEFDISLVHDKPGMLSMANAGPGTNGSQFFITEVPTPFLNYRHAVFGELVKGQDVQDSISNVKTIQPGRLDKPEQDVIIKEINIIRKGKDAKAFDAAKVFTEQEPKLAERREEFLNQLKEKEKEDAKFAAETFLEKNKDYEGEVKRFDTGLVMILNAKEGGEKPSSSDKVAIECAGYFENGGLFYTNIKSVAEANNMYSEESENQGAYEPFTMPYNMTATLVPGFREAMLNMNVGDKARVFIPSYLGYGDQGRKPMIPPHTNLVFDIEIIEIVKK